MRRVCAGGSPKARFAALGLKPFSSQRRWCLATGSSGDSGTSGIVAAAAGTALKAATSRAASSQSAAVSTAPSPPAPKSSPSTNSSTPASSASSSSGALGTSSSGLASGSSGGGSGGGVRSVISQGMKVGAFDGDASEPVALGRVTSRIADNVVVVTFDAVPRASLVVELGSKVIISVDGKGEPIDQHTNPEGGGNNGNNNVSNVSNGSGTSSAENGATHNGDHHHHHQSKTGLVAKVHGNGMYSVLFDDDKYFQRVSRDAIVQSEGRPKFMITDRFKKVLEWVRAAGVEKRTDREATAAILFQRGWREDKMYLLEAGDVHCLSHLNKSVRMGLLEKAEWERDRFRLNREIKRERLKEQSDWRYLLTRYSGVFSAVIGVLGATSVFTWNYKRWVRETREFCLQEAAHNLASKRKVKRNLTTVGKSISRDQEREKLHRILTQMDADHPRVVVLTGAKGTGKSFLLREVASSLHCPVLLVDIRRNEDPLQALIKAFEVTNIAKAGNPIDFVADVCAASRRDDELNVKHRLPLIVFKLHDDCAIPSVHGVAVTLACDRRVCHVAIEVDAGRVEFEHALLPRLDFYHFPSFSHDTAVEYVEHKIDPMALMAYMEVVGTNANTLDELIAAVNQRGLDPYEYIAMKLSVACREIRPKLRAGGKTARFLEDIAAMDFEVGLSAPPWKKGSVDADLDKFVYYNHESQRWVFHAKACHSAVNALRDSPGFTDTKRARTADELGLV